MPGIAEWFCLASERKNFAIDPLKDRKLLLGDLSWESEIQNRLKKSQLLGTPLRLVWWGQYGIGKTHRLRHTEHLVKKSGFDYQTNYVVASDIQEKSGFDRLHYELVNSLGMAEVQEHLRSYFTKLVGDQTGMLTISELCSGSADVENAINAFGNPTPNVNAIAPAWQFLCGQPLEKSQLALVGVSKPRLERAADFSTVMVALAAIVEHETEKQLLFLIDEGENLNRITNRTAEAQWNETLRSILDIKQLNLVVTVGAEKIDALPVLLIRPDIVRRIERDNYVEMATYDKPVAEAFLKGLFANWIDPSLRGELEKAEGWRNDKDYVPELFPFTEKAFHQFCDFATVDPRNAKPSEILAKVNDVVAEAFLANVRPIAKAFLDSQNVG